MRKGEITTQGITLYFYQSIAMLEILEYITCLHWFLCMICCFFVRHSYNHSAHKVIP